LDLFSQRSVGYALSVKNDQTLARAALKRALVLRKPGPYASGGYREILDAHGIQASMSRSGDGYDNAVAESFFSTLEFDVENPPCGISGGRRKRRHHSKPGPRHRYTRKIS
jgi:transposase InsO family protein